MPEPVAMEVEAGKPTEKKPDEKKKSAPVRLGVKKVKAEDFTEEVATKLPEFEKIAETNLEEGLEMMLTLEKKTRLGEDATSTGRIVASIVKVIQAKKNWQLLNTYLLLISKRRGQLKQAVAKMVQTTMEFLTSVPEAERLELIATLRLITEGKIHVELERARLTRMLAGMKEEKGNVAEAADIMQQIQIETIGSMDNREKFDFVLEQMRLALAKGDYIRTEILSKKVTEKVLKDETLQDLKLRYYDLMIQYYQHERRYQDLVRSYKQIYDTPQVQADEKQWKKALTNVAVHLALSPYGNEQSDLMNRVYIDKKIEQLPDFRDMLKFFLTNELLRWPDFSKRYNPLLMSQVEFFSGEQGAVTWSDLEKRVTEHNIRVISQYYSRITKGRLADLLSQTQDVAEKFLCDMVVSGGVYAKIDRPAGLVVFTKPKAGNELLNDWSHGVSKLLELVEDTCHLINKEVMVHKL